MSKINVIGAACIDILVSSIDKDQFFTNKYKVDNIKTYYGGDGLNEAVVLSHFKADTRLITVLGNDNSGKQVLDFLEAKNVLYNSNIIKNDIETYISLVLIDENGQRSFVGNKNGSVRQLELSDINLDEDCEIVSFSSMFISPKLGNNELLKLFKQIKDKGIKLCVDCSTPKNNEKITDMTCLKYADYFFCNETEASLLCDSDSIEEIERIFKENGVNTIIKCGSKGAYYNGKYYNIESIDKPTDTTGAGDCFVAGFVLGLYNNLSIEDCIKQGNTFGRNACEYIGATDWINHL